MNELPLYRSHKLVRAAKIVAIESPDGQGNSSFVLQDGAERVYAPTSMEIKPVPAVGWYLVEYQDEREPAYFSFSPAKAFEEGYTLVSDDTIVTPQQGLVNHVTPIGFALRFRAEADQVRVEQLEAKLAAVPQVDEPTS